MNEAELKLIEHFEAVRDQRLAETDAAAKPRILADHEYDLQKALNNQRRSGFSPKAPQFSISI